MSSKAISNDKLDSDKLDNGKLNNILSKEQEYDMNNLNNILSDIEAQEYDMNDKLCHFLKEQCSDECDDDYDINDEVISNLINYVFSYEEDASHEKYHYKDECCEQKKINIIKYINSKKSIKSVNNYCIKYIECKIKEFINNSIEADL